MLLIMWAPALPIGAGFLLATSFDEPTWLSFACGTVTCISTYLLVVPRALGVVARFQYQPKLE
jgi:hypothetical protein